MGAVLVLVASCSLTLVPVDRYLVLDLLPVLVGSSCRSIVPVGCHAKATTGIGTSAVDVLLQFTGTGRPSLGLPVGPSSSGLRDCVSAASHPEILSEMLSE